MAVFNKSTFPWFIDLYILAGQACHSMPQPIESGMLISLVQVSHLPAASRERHTSTRRYVSIICRLVFVEGFWVNQKYSLASAVSFFPPL